MDPRLLRYYNEELRHLREMGSEFAKAFPKIAARLGMEGLEVTDPYVERLMEGFAFLAGRIQLKIDAEFPRFTQRLLEIVYPQFLAPTPSMLIAQVHPELGDPALAGGLTLPRGSAMLSQPGKAGATPCEFRTAHALTMWPLELTQAEYFTHAADLPMAAVPEWRKYRSGLRLRLRTTAGVDFSQIGIDDLRLHCSGIDDVAYRLHEMACGHALGVLVLPTKRPAAWHEALDGECIATVGFEDDQALLPQSLQGFEGYRVLQEYFAFPQRFLFFDIQGVGDALRRHGGNEVDIVILFGRADNALLQAVDAGSLALNCVPAVNLLDRRCDRIHIGPESNELHVVPDRTRPMDFEVHSVESCTGYGTGAVAEQRFLPLYSSVHTESRSHAAYYTLRREPRILSAKQKLQGPRSSYIGQEVFLSLVDAQQAPYRQDLRQLALTALVSNRDLPTFLPTGGSAGADRWLLDAPGVLARVRCLRGPTRPQFRQPQGDVGWSLVSHLSLNYLSLAGEDPARAAAALRSLLALYGPTQDASWDKQVEGLQALSARQVVRRLPFPGPLTFGTGVEITTLVDELAFQGSSAFLLGGVLDRFFARHVALNTFTESVLRTPSRGEVMRWPARCGEQALA